MIKKISMGVIAGALLGLVASTAGASILLDNTSGGTNKTFNTGSSVNFSDSYWKVFSFKTPNTSASWALDSAVMGFYSNFPTANPAPITTNVTWSLWTANTSANNYQPLALIASTAPKSITITGLTHATATFISMQLLGLPNLVPNTTYDLVIKNDRNQLNARIATYSPTITPTSVTGFSFMKELRTIDTGATYTVQSGAAFELQGHTVPEPSTYALLCLSLSVLGYVRKRMAKGEDQ